MVTLILDNISLILLLPLWIFLIVMCGRFFSVYVNKQIIYSLTLLSSFLGAVMCGFVLTYIKEPVEWLYPFITINNFSISFGLHIDKISLIIALILFTVSFAVQLFSVSYMQDERKNYRFFALLNLFNFAMAFLLFSPNLYQLYVFWELVGIVSYLLIGFDYQNQKNSIASKRVFLINRIGDTALLAGIIITSFYMYSYAENMKFVTLSLENLNSISTLLMAYTTDLGFYIICGLFILGAIVKSAQFPFHIWLQDAMEAKLPVSALLHSSTMVVAGVYLTIVLLPFFTLNQNIMNCILIIGVLTALICSVLAAIETHPKKVLAYSTSANLGVMFVALGLESVKGALIFLIAHAFIKALLFITLPKENKITKTQLVLFGISALSLAGVLFAGMASKEFLFSIMQFSRPISIIFLFVAFATAFYISRLGFLIYKNYELTKKTDLLPLLSFTILLCANICFYLLLENKFNISEPFAAAIGGLCFAVLLAKHNSLCKVSGTPKFIENLYYKTVPFIYEKLSKGLNYIDTHIFANYKPIIVFAGLPVKITRWIENNIMNKSVTTIENASKNISMRDMMLQSGNVQTYNAYAFIILTAIIALLIIGYKILLN